VKFLQFSSSVFSFTFFASKVFARIELEIGALDHFEWYREFAAVLFENHGRSAHAAQRSAVRFLAAHRQRRHDAREPAAKAFVIRRSHQRAVESGRFHFERVGFVFSIELGIESGSDALAQMHVDAARAIDDERQCECASGAARAMRDHFDVAKIDVARQRRCGAFERLDQTRDALPPYNDEARDVPTLSLTTAGSIACGGALYKWEGWRAGVGDGCGEMVGSSPA
jgi:hypothetical protein